MNLESTSSPKKTPSALDLELEDFDFKPITSGLGFSHQQKITEIKPAFAERANPVRETPVVRTQPMQAPKKEMNVYQNDLSLFYGQSEAVVQAPVVEAKPEKVYRQATKMDRIVAYVFDMAILVSVLSVMLMFMAKATGMEVMEAWAQYPDEITPLIVTLFCGFYLLYFAIGEKTGATVGKSLMNIRIVDMDNKNQSFMTLLVRSFITLINFASIGLFSYFDLQNKATNSKMIKVN
ncbi:MAG: RDD family protein [Bdellovibrionota bacterium]